MGYRPCCCGETAVTEIHLFQRARGKKLSVFQWQSSIISSTPLGHPRILYPDILELYGRAAGWSGLIYRVAECENTMTECQNYFFTFHV